MPKFVLDFSNLIGGATYAGWNSFYDAQSVFAALPVGHTSGKVIKLLNEEGGWSGSFNDTINVGALGGISHASSPELDPTLLWLTGKDGNGNGGFDLRLYSGPSWPSSIVLPDSIAGANSFPTVEFPPGSGMFVPQVLVGALESYRAAFLTAIQTNLDRSFSEFDFYEQAASEATVFGRFEASTPGGPIPTFTGRQMLEGAANFDHFDFEVIGSSYADDITGNTGINTFIGSLGSDILTGRAKNDTFDYTDLRNELDLPVGFNAFDPGTLQLIDGGAEDKASGVNKGRDLLKLPGSAVDYNIELDIEGLQLSDSIDWAKTTYDIVSPKSPEPPGAPVTPVVTMRLKNVEWVTFEEPVDNVVTPHLGRIGTEALLLAAEVYGPREALSHKAEKLANDGNSAGDLRPSYIANIAAKATARGWHAVESLELGLKPVDHLFDIGVPDYSFVDGFYASRAGATFANDVSEANALVLTGVVFDASTGKDTRTLAIAFRGTDQFADWVDYGNFKQHYEKFRPLLDAVNGYIADERNGIEMVLVSGHSLGVGPVQHFMQEHEGDARFRAYADGSPGGDEEPVQTSDPRIMHFMHTHDPVTLAPGLTEAAISARNAHPFTVGLTTAAAKFALLLDNSNTFARTVADVIAGGQKKFRVGSEIYLNSERSASFASFDEHDKFSYVQDFGKLYQLAADLDSPFTKDNFGLGKLFAEALSKDAIYNGPSIQIAPGTHSRDSIHVDKADDYALGGAERDRFELIGADIAARKIRNGDEVANERDIDGGADYDTLHIFGYEDEYRLTSIENGGTRITHVWSFLGIETRTHVAEIYRIEKLTFLDRTGRGTTDVILSAGSVQRPALGALTLVVDPAFDLVEAGNGPLTVLGSASSDTITVGFGAKTVTGGNGDDDIRFAAGSPAAAAGAEAAADGAGAEDALLLQGEAGNDVLFGGPGDDQIAGGVGNDVLWGAAGIDILKGGVGDDTYLVDDLLDTIDEGAGDGVDTLQTLLASFRLDDMTIIGAIEALAGGLLTGQSLTGNALVNQVTGASGDDILNGGAEADILDGGAGIDLAAASGVASVVYMDLLSAPGLFFDGTGAVDLILNIEGAIGGSGADFLNGDNGANTLRGGGGIDAILGRGGNDAIDGGDGNDYLMGGTAYDPAQTGSGADTIEGGAGTDIIFGMDGADVIRGGGEADFILAGTGNDTVEGGAGNDFLFGGTNYVFDQAGAGNDNMKGGDGVDFIVGGQGSDALDGEAGDDIVYGGSGIDQVRGGAGNDSVFGDAGNDVVLGGGGFDYLYGGAGGDTFWFRKDDSYDTVFDFAAGQGDRLRLDPALGVTSFAQFQTRVAGFTFEGAAYSVLNFAVLGHNDQITIKGISHTAWTAAMVEFA